MIHWRRDLGLMVRTTRTRSDRQSRRYTTHIQGENGSAETFANQSTGELDGEENMTIVDVRVGYQLRP